MRLLLVGDVHGDERVCDEVAARAAVAQADFVIQLGDLGLDVNPTIEGRLAQLAARYDLPWAWLDGNHDTPWLDEIPAVPGVTRLTRGHRWAWGGVTFVAVGGACLSTGPVAERARYAVTYPDVHQALGGGPADVVLSHDSPDGCCPRPHDAGNRANGDLLRVVVDEVHARLVVHAHHHHRHETTLRHYFRQEVCCAARSIGLADTRAPLSDATMLLDTKDVRSAGYRNLAAVGRVTE